MVGTIINTLAVAGGGALGVIIGRHIPKKISDAAIAILGAISIVLGIKMTLGTANILILLGSLVVGASIGELLGIEERLERFARAAEKKLNGSEDGSAFGKAFISTSLLFCIGPLAILGPIQDGLTGNYQVLLLKSVLDGITAVIFASTLGLGVLFSAISILIVQGSLTLGAHFFERIFTEAMVVELVATGGLILFLLGLKVLEVRQARIANLLPALVIAPLLTYLLIVFGISLS